MVATGVFRFSEICTPAEAARSIARSAASSMALSGSRRLSVMVPTEARARSMTRSAASSRLPIECSRLLEIFAEDSVVAWRARDEASSRPLTEPRRSSLIEVALSRTRSAASSRLTTCCSTTCPA